ncbi:hypothetical protein BE11_01330 [Sorangium cellulosum]|nr:hypothetical protein BE11_01330 [Sorangium cellulosum]
MDLGSGSYVVRERAQDGSHGASAGRWGQGERGPVTGAALMDAVVRARSVRVRRAALPGSR